MYRESMSAEDSRLTQGQVASIRQQFLTHGYAGSVHVVDDQRDEAIFLVDAGAITTLGVTSLCFALQSLLGRKAWVLEESETWRAKARRLW